MILLPQNGVFLDLFLCSNRLLTQQMLVIKLKIIRRNLNNFVSFIVYPKTLINDDQESSNDDHCTKYFSDVRQFFSF